ncbi:DUF1697 domain-containing protein [Caenimonas sedimenti]|uniref:DUF1697 domain-containing protein n=1 Tax=Caenimonas sedimenti TaxID=2596921 RepID=A0A562ZS24_9BURK|nr:DUF1697 domain-containing protein [Caenimonas sedimenti]TWO70954.1 DUF1697 domain-containing protein [Caenimonas sedimenti]
MPRYVALLRGVSPMNAKMAQLRQCYEDAGFTEVVTVLASGNVVFDAKSASEAAVHRQVVAAMEDLPHTFPVILRKQSALKKLVAEDAFAAFKLKAQEKRVVTFLGGKPQAALELPITKDQARILVQHGREIYTAYVPQGNASFMALIERTFGKEVVSTRTWDTVRKCAVA